MRNFLIFISCYFLSISFSNASVRAPKTIVISSEDHVRVRFGAEKLSKALAKLNYSTKIELKDKLTTTNNIIAVGVFSDKLFANNLPAEIKNKISLTQKEGFHIYSGKNGVLYIIGNDASGALYGCVELADQINSTGKLPTQLTFSDQPEMVLRGTCIGLQKPDYLPGHDVYEYPYTPETFPWLYDKALWIKYLDMMVENRYNSLYLWNGHPFSSLLRLKDYPYAVEVDDATLKKNEEIFQ